MPPLLQKGKTMTIEQITDLGITYDVLESKTADDHEVEGLVRTAKWMRDVKCIRQIVAKRPRGKKLYTMKEYASPVGTGSFFSNVFTV